MAVKKPYYNYNPNNPGSTPLFVKGYTNPPATDLTDRGFSSSTAGWANGYGDIYSQGNSSSSGSSGGSSSGSSGRGGISTSASTGGTSNDYYSSIANAILAQKQAALNNAIGNVNSAYSRKTGLLRDSYNSSVNDLKNQYNASAKEVQDDAAKSLREAYVNKMLSQKDLGQQMSALGYSGGATESSMAGLLNNYGNARNNINTTLNDNLTRLNNTLQSNLASIAQSYNSALADAETARANAIAQLSLDNTNADLSSLLSTNSSFMKNLQNALASQSAYEGAPTEANNNVNYVNTQQANDMGKATQAARVAGLAQWAQELADQGYSSTNIARTLGYRGLGTDDISTILNQLA